MFFFFNERNGTEVRKKKCMIKKIEKERNSINLSNILKNVICYHSIKRYRFLF